MSAHYFLLLPLVAGFLYAVAAIFLKQTVDGGLGPWRMMLVNAWAMALCFSPLLLLPSEQIGRAHV